MEILFDFAPFILIIVGVIQIASKDEMKKGKKLILVGIGLRGVEL